jgi:membrane-bound lytic murein transglycosylase D
MPKRVSSFVLAVVVALTISAFPSAAASPAPLARPAALDDAVAFWRRVFTEITTSQGFVHDDRRLDIVYATVPMRSPGTRERTSEAQRTARHYADILRKLGNGRRKGLSAEESRVLRLWGVNVDNATLRAASARVRIQRGQADKFREGLVRSGAWVDYIERAFEAAGVPKEIGALPHVESSFDPTARSFVGAAGMWQFMASTGRRYMRIDALVDERLDPERASDAAALLMRHNFEVTESWPLAITAYNHGAGGMRNAIRQVGTRDIARIVAEYRSRTFGFASRNFYVSLLAALDVRNQAESYFGKLERHPPRSNAVIALPGYVSIATLERAVGVDRDTLASLNPALLPGVWNGSKFVPKGYRLRLPASVPDGNAWLASVNAGTWLARQKADEYHVVRRGETLSTIAPRYGARVSDLVSINSLSSANRIRVGQRLVLPGGATAEPVVADGVYANAASARPGASEQVSSAVAAAPRTPDEEADAVPEPIAITQGEDAAPAADPSDYAVAEDSTVRVQEGESLVQFATWLEIDAARLQRTSGLRSSQLRTGQRVRLDFSEVSVDQFERRRLDYHRGLQERFFARFRIAGTNEHVVRRGESVWLLAERRYNVPIWLLRQYNPDVDLDLVKPGARVVIPVVRARSA